MLTTVGLIVGFAIQYGLIVWWASKITANLQSHLEKLVDLQKDVSGHIEQDREFQLTVVERLGSLSTTIPSSRSNGRP